MSYVLTVGWSSSPAFARVQALAAAVPGATTDGTGRAWTARVPLVAAHAAAWRDLLALVASWRHTRLAWDETPLPASTLLRLSAVLGCADEAAAADAGALHCWGLTVGTRRRVPCRFLEGVLPWRPDAAAAQLGAALAGAARVRGVAACPAFDPAAIQTAVARWAAGADPCQAALAELGPVGAERRALTRLLDGVDLDNQS